MHGFSVANFWLSFFRILFFLRSTIIGATTGAKQIQYIDSADVVLSDEIMQQIEAVHVKQPNPSP
jgi:aryl-alcohol dehydrogenase-like predicted oxidoreductase